MAVDLSLLRLLADTLQRYSEELRALNPVAIVEEFAENLKRELDFRTEAAGTARFHRLFSGQGGVRSPRVFWEYSRSAVLTLEYLAGPSLRQALEQGLDEPARRRVAEKLLANFTEQYFRAGFFHADPHPGNILLLPDGTVGLVDFGSLGGLAPERQWQLALILAAVPDRDVGLIVDTLAEMEVLPQGVRGEVLQADLLHLLQRFEDTPLQALDARLILGELSALLRRHGVVLPRELVLLARSLAAVVGIARELHPGLNLAGEIAAATTRLVRDQASPRPLLRSTSLNLVHLFRLLAGLPRDVRTILRRVRDGQAEIAFRHRGLDGLISELDRASNRLTVALIAAALIIGSSLLVTVSAGPQLGGLSLLGLGGYLVAGMLGLYLLFSILRSGRF